MYYNALVSLSDTLTKREYLYHQILSNNNKLLLSSSYLINGSKNQLISDIKSLFISHDLIFINNEFSKNIYFNSLEIFNFNILKIFSLNSHYFNTFFFFFYINDNSSLKNSLELYKNQYKPLKKGITNLLRLHATGAIAMPIEIRIQILASSKDVIHSWAIPSAGVKIDCIPGYSSHKVIIFLNSGIF